jgi:serine/threonine protein kinase
MTTSEPKSLLDHIRGDDKDHSKPKPQHPLENRIQIAKDIVTALLYIHSVEWVRKSVRSENILIARSTKEEAASNPSSNLGVAYLKGFDYWRRDAGQSTGFDQVRDWRREIYQHPHRQEPSELAVKEMPKPADEKGDQAAPYIKAYDVYSLGVVFLELAIWKSLAQQASVFEKVSPVERGKRMVEIARAKVPPRDGKSVHENRPAMLEHRRATGREHDDRHALGDPGRPRRTGSEARGQPCLINSHKI